MDAINSHARFDDFDIDARSQWVGKAKNQRCLLSASNKALSIKLATTVDHCLRDLAFANVTLPLQTFIWLDHLDISLFPILIIIKTLR